MSSRDSGMDERFVKVWTTERQLQHQHEAWELSSGRYAPSAPFVIADLLHKDVLKDPPFQKLHHVEPSSDYLLVHAQAVHLGYRYAL